MCGIVAGVAERNIVPILLMGLKRLEYRGYDSAGLAIIQQNQLIRYRAMGKVQTLQEKVQAQGLIGYAGIAHTRWATHGAPSEANAHPHSSGDIAVVHNGIIENYLELKQFLQAEGYAFSSETDSETVAHLIHYYYQKTQNLVTAVRETTKQLECAYALAVIHAQYPDELVAIRHGSPLVIGIGIGEHFIASDSYALLPVTRTFSYLQDDDLVHLSKEQYQIFDAQNQLVERALVESEQSADVSGKGGYKHFMQKEMFEQPSVIAETLEGRIYHEQLQLASFPSDLLETLKTVRYIDLIACGTSYHAGLVIKSQLEKVGIRCHVEYASEYLYREITVPQNTLFLSISQSGETADTLAALEKAKKLPYQDYLAICNVPESALIRASHYSLLTRAGREIGVASTKAFVTQLVALHILVLLIRQLQNNDNIQPEIAALERLPAIAEQMLALNPQVAQAAEMIKERHGCLFLGRGESYAIAAEGALKLKELAYIHAEAYPCGELKHGPLALVDENMPVVAIVQADHLAEKTMSNLQEVQARGGRLIVFADSRVDTRALNEQAILISLGELDSLTASIAAVIPLQLFAYNVALQKGTDVDQPRNLAKSVTVE